MSKRNIILIVDDMEVNRIILHSIFEKEYTMLEAENGEQAMVLVNQYHDRLAAILLDIIMPIKDGYQVLTELGSRGFLTEFPVVVITAENSAENEVKVFNLGASDIIVKPFEPHVVKRRVQNNIELNQHRQNQDELIEEQAAKLRESNAVMIDALSSIIEFRSVETGQHIQRIRMFTKVLLEDVAQSYPEFLLDERKINIIVSASAMHDIGKIAIPDAILNKPGRLTKDEFQIMKTHAAKGSEMLSGLSRMADREYLQYAYNICRYHHERWDGRGYPECLKADSIPVCAQVVGVADCYDALTTDRVYKKAIPPNEAFNMILNGECGAFSPKLMESFKNVQQTFARLSRDYADHKRESHEAIQPLPPTPSVQDGMLDTLRLGQMKYFTLLKYADSTVVELDWTTRTYHVVYLSSDDFAILKTGKYFGDSVREFARKSVCPDDMTNLFDDIDAYVDKFFDDGLMKKSRRYRVYSRSSRGYLWCVETMLRIDAEDPRQRRALVIWHEEPISGKRSKIVEKHNQYLLQNIMGGTQMMRNDRWLTMPKVGDYLLNLLGYTQEEFQEKFHNRFINLVRPAYQKDVFQRIKNQIRHGKQVEIEYQVTTKDGRIVWLLDKSQLVTSDNGEEYFYNILIDITSSKSVEEELRLLSERQRIIMEQTNDIIIEWDIESDSLYYSPNCRKRLGYEPISDKASLAVPTASHVHPDDLASIANLFTVMRNGQAYEEVDLRIANAAGRYCWYRLRAAAQFDGSGKTCKVVVVATDIDEEKRGLQVLRNKAERDGLTKLLNKQTAQQKIEEYLLLRNPASLSAMLVIDVDDFKQVNDRFGHMVGDDVLQLIADQLRHLFRTDDILARIGGDEFLIYLRDVPSKELVEARTRRIIEAIGAIDNANLEKGMLGCCIGIAYCPDDSNTFDDLFIRADRALYAAKFQGKKDFREYDAATMEESQSSLLNKSGANTRIDSEREGLVPPQVFVEEAFQCLYAASDIGKAVESVLAMAGKQYNLARVYIFEESGTGETVSNTFEWCDNGVLSRQASCQNLTYGSLGHSYKSVFDENGLFYCKNTTSLPYWQRLLFDSHEEKTMAQYVILDNGAYKGFIGYDDHLADKTWPEEQILTLDTLSHLLATFLRKKRAEEQDMNLTDDFFRVLHQQDAWIYVIDPDSFILKYVNEKVRRDFPDVVEGAICYRAFYRSHEPCAKCPIRRDRFPADTKTYHKGALQMAKIHWQGQEFLLMTCRSRDLLKKNKDMN